MAMTWDEAQLAFPILRDRAIREQTCFCKCGCRAEGVTSVVRFGKTEPGICAKCQKSRAIDLHERAVGAASIYREADEVPAKVAATPVSDDERAEAVAYLTGYGDDATPLVERLRKRLDSYKTLTDAEVRSALRSKDADVRYAQRVVERVESRRVPRYKRNKRPVPVERVHIPKSLPAGDYAISDGRTGWLLMRVDRCKRGKMRGWVFVYAAPDPSLVKIGAQRPLSLMDALTGSSPEYSGKMPNAVALLISNPTKAAADYRQLMEGAE